MKKTLLLAVFVAFLTHANAQETTFGIKLGPNFANVGGDLEDNKMKIGLHFGGVANIMLSETFAFAPELLLSTQGTKWKEDGYEDKYNLTYLNLPLLAKLYVSENFNIHAGPTVGFLLSAKNKGEADGEEWDDDIKDGMKGLDFGLAFGAGYELTSGLNFGARYNLGLANIFDAEEDDDDKATNQVIQLFVGFNF